MTETTPSAGMRAMNDKRNDVRTLYRTLYGLEEQDQTDAPPSLLPWIGYAALGLLTVIGLAVGVLALLQIA